MKALLALAALGLSVAHAAEETLCTCGKEHLFPAPTGNKPGRKYARDRRVDIGHLRLEVTPDFKARSVSGQVTLSFKPIATPLSALELDAVGLEIAAVTATGADLAGWQSTDEKLVLDFRQPIAPEAEASVSVTYRAHPERGLYFRTPEMGYPATDTQVWSQGEAELHRHWFPCYDYPNERFTTEVICHAPEGMEVMSNGSLVSREPSAGGLVRWHWKQSQPHVNYLIALAAGNFHKIEDKAGNLPLSLLVSPSDTALAANAFQDTKKIIDFFQREIGVPFPWDKYAQVYCHDFVAGGMENTSSTFLAQSMLYSSETEQLRSLHGLDAHETAHQWFGDLVTCRDWSHLWLNEGFASYYTCLYEGEKFGPDGFKQILWKEAQRVIGAAPDTKPIVWRDYPDPMSQFDYRAYPKGAWVLHMLRSQLGPDLFRKAVKTYLDRHRGSIVTSDDLQDVFEEVSGLSFDQFFDQWLHHGGVPELAASYAWDGPTKMAKISVRQTQKVSPEVPLFRFPLPVRFHLPGGAVKDVTFTVSQAEEDFYAVLEAAPELVRLDPDLTVLAKVNFTPPGDMLKRQLQSDLMGRLAAVQILGDRKDDDSVAQLGKVLAEDGFWSVRAEAVKSLRKINNAASARQLLAAPPQPDARVRQELVEALGALLTPESVARLTRLAAEEKNPEVLADIIPALAASGQPVTEWLGRDSFRQTVTAATIDALRRQDATSQAAAVLERLQKVGPAMNARSFGAALDDLAFLWRKQPDATPVLAWLTGFLTDPRENLRASAARALGTLGQASAIAPLRALTTVRKPFNDPVRSAAEAAIQKLESLDPGSADLRALVERLQTLQKRTEELSSQLEKLEKKTTPAKP